MGELGSGLGSDFPTQLDIDNSKEVDYPAADKTVQRADVPNDLAATVLAIEAKVGIDNSADANSIDYKMSLAIKSGKIEMWGGSISNIPSGYLLCDGAEISRETYADLFSAIGTIHGEGDGSITFNLPNLRDKFVIGAKQDDSGKPKTNLEGSLKQSGGETNQPPRTEASPDTRADIYHPEGQETDTVDGHKHVFKPPYYAMVFIIKT